MPSRKGNECGQHGAFIHDGIFDHLNKKFLTFFYQMIDGKITGWDILIVVVVNFSFL